MNNLVAAGTIEEYKNNKGILEGLKLKLKSGAFTAYDIALYNALVEANKKDEEELKLKLQKLQTA